MYKGKSEVLPPINCHAHDSDIEHGNGDLKDLEDPYLLAYKLESHQEFLELSIALVVAYTLNVRQCLTKLLQSSDNIA